MVKSQQKRRSVETNDKFKEHGVILKHAGVVVALGYPASHSVAISSLGMQTVYRRWNDVEGLACLRFVVPKTSPPWQFELIENRRSVKTADFIALSVACETELAVVVGMLEGCGLHPFARDRGEDDPSVIIGGPLTWVDPKLVAPLADVVVVGEAEPSLLGLGNQMVEQTGKGFFLEELSRAGLPGVWIPSLSAVSPVPAVSGLSDLPAAAAVWSPDAEFRDLFLVEVARGCPHGCGFCVMSARSGGCNRKYRPVPPSLVFDAVPLEAPGVGLVGAAVTDHPQIQEIIDRFIDRGQRVSLSSIRAEHVNDSLVEALKKRGI